MHYRFMERRMSDHTRALFQRQVSGFSRVIGLSGGVEA
jgi:hypothetical protein